MQVAIFDQKYDDPLTYLVTSDEEWERVCFQVLKERVEARYFYPDPGEEPIKPEPFSGDMPSWAEVHWEKVQNEYNKRYNIWKSEKWASEKSQLAVETKDLGLAREIIERRSDRGFQYETFKLVPVLEVASPYWKYSAQEQVENYVQILLEVADGTFDSDAISEAIDKSKEVAFQLSHETEENEVSVFSLSARGLGLNAMKNIQEDLKRGDEDSAQRWAERVLKREIHLGFLKNFLL